MLKGLINKVSFLYDLLVLGNQKAIVAFIVPLILAPLALVGISGEMTVSEALGLLCTFILSGVSVWFTKNKK